MCLAETNPSLSANLGCLRLHFGAVLFPQPEALQLLRGARYRYPLPLAAALDNAVGGDEAMLPNVLLYETRQAQLPLGLVTGQRVCHHAELQFQKSH